MTVEGAGFHLIEKGTPETLSMSWYLDGALTDPGTVTIGITNLAGTTIVAAATATSGSGAAARTYALTAANAASLDTYTVTWTPAATYGAQVQLVEIIGEHLFTLDDLETYEGSVVTTAGISLADKERGRAKTLQDFEDICCVSFVPRYRRETLDGTGRCDLRLPSTKVTSIRSIEYRESGSTTWTAFTADELADVLIDPWGRIERETLGVFTAGRRNWRVGYEHGWDRVPEPIRKEALRATRYDIIPTSMNERAISISTAAGTEQLWTPGYSGRGSAIHPLPETDRVLRQYRQCLPGMA